MYHKSQSVTTIMNSYYNIRHIDNRIRYDNYIYQNTNIRGLINDLLQREPVDKKPTTHTPSNNIELTPTFELVPNCTENHQVINK